MKVVRQSNVLGQEETDVPYVPHPTVRHMSIVTARYLLSFLMTIGGLNGFLNVAHHPLPTLILARRYIESVLNSQYMRVVAFLQDTGVGLVFAGRCMSLALAMLVATSASFMNLSHINQAERGPASTARPAVLWASPSMASSKAHLVKSKVYATLTLYPFSSKRVNYSADIYGHDRPLHSARLFH